jgi:tRNA/tmRNA/rRNA uracil-C5-methylase (TrmA/RlmC/RlmD family)
MLWGGAAAPSSRRNHCPTDSTTAHALRAAARALLPPLARRRPRALLPPPRRSAAAASSSSSSSSMAPLAPAAAAAEHPPQHEHPHEHLLRLGACGRVAPDRYEDQLALKLERLRALFASPSPPSPSPASGARLVEPGAGDADPAAAAAAAAAASPPVPIPATIQVFRSAPTHYRMRAEFQVWTDRKPANKERQQAAAAAAAAAAGDGGSAVKAASGDDDDGVTDLYFIMHERVPVVPEPTPPELSGESEEEEEEGGADASPAKDATAADEPADARPGNKKRPRRSFRRRRSDRAPASAPAGLGAPSDATGVPASDQQRPSFKMQRVRIDTFPAGSRLVNALMRLLRARLLAREPLRRRLFQANFHTTLSGQAMVTLVYHRSLDAAWEEEARATRGWLLERLAEEAAAGSGTGAAGGEGHRPPAPRCTELQIVGRCRGRRIDIERNWIEEEMELRPLPLGAEEEEEEEHEQEEGHARRAASALPPPPPPSAGPAAASSASDDPSATRQQQQQQQQHQRVRYRQVEASFSQPNAGVCRQMVGWALDVTRPAGGAAAAGSAAASASSAASGAKNDHDLLELYCGNGNFSVPLAANFRRVLATEVSATSVDAARHNAHAHGLAPPPPPPATADGHDGQPEPCDPPARLFVARLSAEEFSATWRTGAARRRLAGLGAGGMAALDLRTALVDPPRAGLDDLTRGLLLDPRFRRVVYVSCNPVTLKRDLALLTSAEGVARAWAAAGAPAAVVPAAGGGGVGGAAEAAPAPPPQPYRIERFAAFDQFPYTEHLECGAYLVRDD